MSYDYCWPGNCCGGPYCLNPRCTPLKVPAHEQEPAGHPRHGSDARKRKSGGKSKQPHDEA